ncbi:hypothetical protein D3C85_834480 [compost metagenome]
MQIQPCARGHDDAQIGRRVVQQVRQGVTDRQLGQGIHFIQNQYGFATQISHFRQPLRQPFLFVTPQSRNRLECAGKRRPTAANCHGNSQPLDKTRTIILCIQRHPGHHGAVRQTFTAPLGQQKGFAEACRRLNGDHHFVCQFLGMDTQAVSHPC